jgi:archaellum component FlaC
VQLSSNTTPALSPMSKVANVLADIIQNHKLEDTVRQKITEAIGYAREEPIGQAKVGITQDNIWQDIDTTYTNLCKKIRGVQDTANKALQSTSKVLKEVEEAKTEARDITRKVSRVTEATDKITSKTETVTALSLDDPLVHMV